MRSLGTCFFIGWTLVFLYTCSQNSRAHYDHNPAQGRHYYQIGSSDAGATPVQAQDFWNADAGAGYLTCDGPGALQAHPDGPLYDPRCATTSTLQWDWCAHVSSASGGCGIGSSQSWQDEFHCGYDTSFDGEFCTVRGDQCATGKGHIINWLTNEQPYGINIPDEDGLFGDFGVYRGCSLTVSTTTDHGNGTYTVNYQVTGDFHLDHDLAQNTLTLRASRTTSYEPVREEFVNCIPPLVDDVSLEPVDDWGQTGSCEGYGGVPVEEPPPACGGEGEPPCPPETLPLPEGAATEAEQQAQTAVLEEIRDGINAGLCDPATDPDACVDDLGYEGPGGLFGLPSAKTFDQTLADFWNSAASAPLIQGVDNVSGMFAGTSQCPTWSDFIPLVETTLVIDGHCTAIAPIEDEFRIIMLIAWSLLGIFIILSA